MTHKFTTFSEAEQKIFANPLKIGLLATINPQGEPHITLISTLKAGQASQVTWGQFTEGLSKAHVRANPCTGFFIMTLDRHFWSGKARWSHTLKDGPDYDWYNNVPMFRYNAYFGIHTVHVMDLVEHGGENPLPMNRIIFAAVQTLLARRLSPSRPAAHVFNTWTREFLSKLDNLKFLSYVDSDGYPVILPVIQAQAAGPDEILFSNAVYRQDLERIPPGSRVALLGMALSMEDVLVRGTYHGIRRRAGLPCGSLTVDWVYNAMPPIPGQIYPPQPLTPVTEF